MTKVHTILILPDGETWNTIGGCSIVTIDEEQFQSLCRGDIDARDLALITEITILETN